MDFTQLNMTYIEDAINNMENKTVVFWGAGRRVRGFLQTYCIDKNYLPLPDFICDSTRDVPDTHIYNIPVLEFDQLKEMDSKNTAIIITAGLLDLQAQVIPNELYYFPIYHCRSFETYFYLKDNYQNYLMAVRLLNDEHSKHVYKSIFSNLLNGSLWCQSLFEPSPYFGNDIVRKLDDTEHIILAGAFNGKHIDRAFANNSKITVCAFEPNSEWHKVLAERYKTVPNVRIHNKALWDKIDKLKFNDNMSNYGLDAHVCDVKSENYDFFVESIDLDSTIMEKVTLIALDVEGSEQRAIKGATGIISRDRPKLAICLYHSIDDYIKIPMLVNQMNLTVPYRLYVKQHSCVTAIETVLYAI